MNAIFKQNYTLELFIALKMAISCCLGLRGNLDFLQKKFYNINSWPEYEKPSSEGPEDQKLILALKKPVLPFKSFMKIVSGSFDGKTL